MVKADSKTNSTKPKKVVKKTKKITVPQEFSKNNYHNGIELSMMVAKKLKEAALELGNKDTKILELTKDIDARNEIITGFKGKVIELQSAQNKLIQEIGAFRAKEQIELQKERGKIINNLIYLYGSFGINKSQSDLNNFQTAQLIELSKALEVTLDKKSTSVREIKNVQQVHRTAVSDVKNKVGLSNDEIAKGLFGNQFY